MEDKKKSRFSRIADKVKDTAVNLGEKAIDTSKSAANKAKEFTEKEIQNVKDKRAWNRGYQNSTHEYELIGIGQPGKPTIVRAFRDIDNLEIYIKSDEVVLKQLKSGTILHNLKDDSRLKVNFVDDSSFVMKEFKADDIDVEVQCVRLKCTILIDEKPRQINNVVNQNLSINNSNVDGGVNQISDISNKLDDLNNELQVYKPKFSDRKRHQQTIKMYGSFKEAIINGEKDSSVVSDFISLLSYAPKLVSLALQIIK